MRGVCHRQSRDRDVRLGLDLKVSHLRALRTQHVLLAFRHDDLWYSIGRSDQSRRLVGLLYPTGFPSCGMQARQNETNGETLGVCLTAAAGDHDTPIVVMARSQR